MDNGDILVRFLDYQRGITPGQFAALYNDDGELLASGTIFY
jgi:tRNA U34 2-thiouridine synthase MnmA/TrmU